MRFAAIINFSSKLTPYIGCLWASTALHRILLNGCVRAPMGFFDTTPVGRILSRFSKDIDVLDVTLPPQISDFLTCATQVRGHFPVQPGFKCAVIFAISKRKY